MKKALTAVIAILLFAVVSLGSYSLGLKNGKQEEVKTPKQEVKIPKQYGLNIVDNNIAGVPLDSKMLFDSGELTEFEKETISRRDFPLLDIYYGRKDDGAIIIEPFAYDFDSDISYILTDTELLNINKDTFFVNTFAVGRGTTAQFNVDIYKNGKLEKYLPVISMHLGEFEDKFIPVKKVEETDLKSDAKVIASYLRKPLGGFTIDFTVHDSEFINNYDVFFSDIELERKISKLYNISVHNMEAKIGDFDSSDKEAKCSLYISCDKSYYNSFDVEPLKKDVFFGDVKISDYSQSEESNLYYVAVEE